MQVKQTKSENLKREYTIIVPAASVEKQRDAKLKEIGKTVKMPGFRPGKVPMDLVKKQHGTRVMGEVLEEAVKSSSSEAIAKEGLRPAHQPKMEVISFEDGKDLEYKMEIEVLPDVPEVKFQSYTVEKPVVEVEDAEIDKALKKLAEQSRHFHTKEGKSVKGDAVIIDFEGFVDDVAFDGGKAEGHQLELGSNSFIPGFEDQLIGVKAGDAVDVNVQFPKDYGSENLAGKDALFKVKVHEVQAPHAMEKADDHLAETLGFEDLTKLRDAVKAQIEKEVQETIHAYAKKDLFDKLDQEINFDLPETLVKQEFDSIWRRVEEGMKANPDAEEFAAGEKALKQEYQEMSKRRVKLGILLAEVGNREKIEISQEEIMQALIREASQYRGQEKQVFDFYRNNPKYMEALKGPLMEDKVVDFALNQVKITEKKMSMDALRTLGEAEAQQGKKATEGKKSSSKSKAKNTDDAKKTDTKKSTSKQKKSDD